MRGILDRYTRTLTVGQSVTVSPHPRTVFIIIFKFKYMLKLDFIMPKVKKGRKTPKRDRSPSPAFSERPT